MRAISAGGYTRISKHEARRRFNECKASYMTPVNMSPASMWAQPVPIPVHDGHNSFSEIVNAFEYYNCNAEAGSYTAFYRREGLE